MQKKIEWKWETIDSSKNNEVARARVIGGWLVCHTTSAKGMLSESMCFVADRDHEWHIIPPILDEEKPRAEKLAADFAAS